MLRQSSSQLFPDKRHSGIRVVVTGQLFDVADEVIDLLIPVIFNWYPSRQWRRPHGGQS